MEKSKANKWLAEKTDAELLMDIEGLGISIFVNDCFGVHDLVEYVAIASELTRRGYEEQNIPRWVKSAPEEE